MRKDAETNRLEILKVARFLIAQQGSDISMRAIASAAGVGVATLYRNFPTRSDLLRGIAEQVAQEFQEIATETLGEWDGDPESAWRRFVYRVAALQVAGVVNNLAGNGELEQLVEELGELQRQRIGPKLIAVLDRAKASGLATQDLDIDRFREGVATITRPLPHLSTLGISQEQSWLIDVFLRGIRP